MREVGTECPFCRELVQHLRRLPAADGASLRIVFKFFPLASIHPWAETAAQAAGCADFQSGVAFWRVHDHLFSHQAAINPANAAADIRAVLAKTPGFGLAGYDRCMRFAMGAGVVARDEALGRGLGINGTPTFFLNGRRFDGAGSPTAFRADVASALAAAKAAHGS